MNKFDTILNDNEIVERYKKIEEYELETGGYAYHNLEHVKNVIANVEKLLIGLNYDDNFIEEAKIAALLHDTGAIEGKKDHAYKGYVFAGEYLKRKGIKLEREKMVLEAIKLHSNSFDTDNIMALVLILSDKLDVKQNRITPNGMKIEGNRQFGHVLGIDINISSNNLVVNFITDEEIDIKELEDYYFTIKIFKVIKAFCNKMNLNGSVLINNTEWTCYNKV